MKLPADKEIRKQMPVARGVLDYFPNAIAEVARVSYVGNQQHNPGEPLHWSREKSTDHADCIGRHLFERGTFDTDGMRHSAKIAWRALALLQLEIEQDEADKKRGNDNCRDGCSVYDQKQAAMASMIEKTGSRNADLFNRLATGEFDQSDVYPITVPPDSAWQPGNENDTVDVEYEETVKLTGIVHVARELMFRDLLRLQVSYPVARQISSNTTFASGSEFVYIAGPMRGYPDANFPAFDAARDRLHGQGYNVISPADIDRAAKDAVGVRDDGQPVPNHVYVYRDVMALYYIAIEGKGGNIAMLPGWERSVGAVAEFFLARWLGLKVLDATTGTVLRRPDYHALSVSVRQFIHEQVK